MKSLNVSCYNKKKSNKIFNVVSLMVMAGLLLTAIVTPAFAAGYETTIKTILDNMIDIIGTIFVAVGIILSIYSVGQLVLAFKNEDADSKSRASTMLVVGAVLIALPSIISGLNLTDYIIQ